MQWKSSEGAEFRGGLGSLGQPNFVEAAQLIDREGNVLATFQKAVDGTFSLSVTGSVSVSGDISATGSLGSPTVSKLTFANGQTFSALTTAITANSTTTAEPAGSIGITSHATGVGKLFMSDGSKWQFAAVA